VNKETNNLREYIKFKEMIEMMLSNPKDKERLKAGVKELSDSMTRVEAERDLQKDIVEAVFDEIGVDKKIIKKFASMYHKQNFTQVQSEFEEVTGLYEDIFG
jgi:hypothetical protein|tara:strand:- start:1248 stop:1553 length:306 start_codon:yes stop_codon:yes gene_type:complete